MELLARRGAPRLPAYDLLIKPFEGGSIRLRAVLFSFEFAFLLTASVLLESLFFFLTWFCKSPGVPAIESVK